jgi:hypothetical protein
MTLASRMRTILLVAPLFLIAAGGCGGARFVGQDQYGGVVAIPANNNYWPTHYREEAEKLMAQKCPQGYVIDHEEEVVIGQMTTAGTSTDTRNYDLPGGNRSPAGSLTTTTTNRSMSVQDKTEYRITFHAKIAAPAPTVIQTGARVVVPPTPPGLPTTPVPIGN